MTLFIDLKQTVLSQSYSCLANQKIILKWINSFIKTPLAKSSEATLLKKFLHAVVSDELPDISFLDQLPNKNFFNRGLLGELRAHLALLVLQEQGFLKKVFHIKKNSPADSLGIDLVVELRSYKPYRRFLPFQIKFSNNNTHCLNIDSRAKYLKKLPKINPKLFNMIQSQTHTFKKLIPTIMIKSKSIAKIAQELKEEIKKQNPIRIKNQVIFRSKDRAKILSALFSASYLKPLQGVSSRSHLASH
jgi:hypothetical protein